MLMKLSWTLLALSTCTDGAYVKINAADPGTKVWLAHGGCTGQKSPVGLTNVRLIVADAFLFSGLPGKKLASKWLTADGKHLLASAQEFFCNATVWVPKFKLTNAVKGGFVWQSSYAYNLCGMGYATGPWKSMSEYMKTLEGMGAVGTTVFMSTHPSRYMNAADLCGGVTMPTTTSSLTYFLPMVFKVLGAQQKGKPMMIDIPSMDWNAGAFYVWGYLVGALCGIVCLATVFLAVTGLIRLANKRSFLALVLGYESIAGFFRALVFFTCSPVGWGYSFYVGMGANTLNHLISILGPLGLPTTFLTALVWLKFSVFRTTPPAWFDPLILLATLGLTIALWVAALLAGFTLESQGILAAGVAAAGDAARQLGSKIKIPFSAVSLLTNLVANFLWLRKLSKAGGASAQLAAVARTCMKFMSIQVVLLAVGIFQDAAYLTWSNPPILDKNGALTLPLHGVLQAFVEPVVESLLAITQVLAIRALSSSSSSSS